MKGQDFEVVYGGSVSLIIPLNRDARIWLDENIGDDALYFGKGLAVEHRYLDQVIDGMMSAGLKMNEEVQ